MSIQVRRTVVTSEMTKSGSLLESPTSQQTAETFPTAAENEEPQGIDIPHFLQPLLGMNFVPFVQSNDSSRTMEKEKKNDEPSSNGSILKPELKAVDLHKVDKSQEEEVNNEANKSQFPVDDIDINTNECTESIQSAKKKKKKKKRKSILRRMRKSMGGGKHKSLSEDIAYKSSGDSISLQSVEASNDCDVNSVLTADSIETLDFSIGSMSTTSTGLRLFKSKVKQSSTIAPKDGTMAVHNSRTAPAQGALKWLQTQQSSLQNHQSELRNVQSEMKTLQAKSDGIQERALVVSDEITLLQSALKKAEMKLRNEMHDFEAAKAEMARLEMAADQASKAVLESFKAIKNGPSVEVQATVPSTLSHSANPANAPTPKIANSESSRQAACFEENQSSSLEIVKSNSFMRVHDFDIDIDNSLDSSVVSPELLFVDDNLKLILENLAKLGLEQFQDESDRFKPTKDTKRTIARYEENRIAINTVQGKDVLVWMGDCGHTDHGSKWPMIKARGLVQTSPRELTEFLLDSSRIKEYNKMSQGRDDVVVFQQDLDTSAEDSEYGIPGAIKVLRSRNKPKLLPKAIEITSLLYAKPIETSPGAYILVNRSIFEDDKGTLKNDKDTITSEMLLGVNLIRPADDTNSVSEFNTITHCNLPGVPEYLAKRVAPTSAMNMIKDIQKLF